MKVKSAALAGVMLFLALISHALVIDAGGSIGNDTALTGTLYTANPATFMQRDRLTAWLNFEFDDTLRFTAQGSYTFDITNPVFLDLEYFSLYGVGQVSFNIGRSLLSGYNSISSDCL